MKLKKIQKILKNEAKNKTRASTNKFVPTAKKVYGVRGEILNDIVKKIKEPDFDLIEKLWKSGAFEERLLAVKILGKICKKNSEKTLKLTEKFSKELDDWVICDTLGTQSVRKIIKDKKKEFFCFPSEAKFDETKVSSLPFANAWEGEEESEAFFALSKKLIDSKNLWQRRLAIVLLIELNRRGFNKGRIKKLIKKVERDKEYYVKKAITWLTNELTD